MSKTGFIIARCCASCLMQRPGAHRLPSHRQGVMTCGLQTPVVTSPGTQRNSAQQGCSFMNLARAMQGMYQRGCCNVRVLGWGTWMRTGIHNTLTQQWEPLRRLLFHQEEQQQCFLSGPGTAASPCVVRSCCRHEYQRACCVLPQRGLL